MSSPTADEARSTSLTAETYERIRSDILVGRLRPREKLKVDVLRDRFGSGASPIREALSQLTAEGLVDRFENRGFRVRDVSAADFAQLLQARCWVEEIALRESIRNGKRAWEDEVVLSFHHLSRTRRSTDPSDFTPDLEWEARHRRFHGALLAACGSHHLLRFCDALYDQAVRYRWLSNVKAYPERDVDAEHKAIMDAALDRDVHQATEALIQHYRRTGEYLSDLF